MNGISNYVTLSLEHEGHVLVDYRVGNHANKVSDIKNSKIYYIMYNHHGY